MGRLVRFHYIYSRSFQFDFSVQFFWVLKSITKPNQIVFKFFQLFSGLVFRVGFLNWFWVDFTDIPLLCSPLLHFDMLVQLIKIHGTNHLAFTSKNLHWNHGIFYIPDQASVLASFVYLLDITPDRNWYSSPVWSFTVPRYSKTRKGCSLCSQGQFQQLFSEW